MRNSTRLFLGCTVGLALLPGSDPVCADNDRHYTTGTLYSDSHDVRFTRLEANDGGTLSLWGQWVRRAAQEALGFEEKFGYGIGVSHDQKGVLGGSNTLAVTYRKGAAVVQGTRNPNSVREDQGYDLDRSSMWEVNNNFLVEPSDKLAMQWGAVARVLDFGRKGRAGNMLRWYSTGVKPIYRFTDRVNLATEFGVDYVDDEYRDLKGSVRKYTIALQLTGDRESDDRPTARLFFTKATWSEEIKGLTGTSLGDAPYGGVTEGWTAGVQLEASW